MNLLVDTQSIIWFSEDNDSLSQNAQDAIEDTKNTCYVSIASFWEMSIKKNLGKLEINGLSLTEFMEEVSENGFLTLDIRKEHIAINEVLPMHHRDPFDRMIIAQAMVEGMPIVSSDAAFDDYDVTRIW